MRSHKSHLTAIVRKTLPIPTQWIRENEYAFSFPKEVIKGYGFKILDYGCGKCHAVNNQYFPADGYDPYYRPKGLPKGKEYDVIICNYVLCTLPTASERLKVLQEIRELLNPNGVAYITVRTDEPDQGWGYSKRGTYQAKVNLSLPLAYEGPAFKIYRLTKDDAL